MLNEAAAFKTAGRWVFTGKDGRALAVWQLSRLVSSLHLGGTLHGFRASFGMLAAEVGVTREIAESCLAHQLADAAEKAYARSDLLERGRELMEDWSAYILSTAV